jgi:Lon protease-like protein
LQPDGLNVGEVEYLPQEGTQPVPEEHRALTEALRSVLPQLEDVYASVTPRFDDASWVSFRLAEIVPLDLTERLALLTLQDPLERLKRIAAALPRQRLP